MKIEINHKKEKKIDKTKLRIFSEYNSEIITFLKNNNMMFEIWNFNH